MTDLRKQAECTKLARFLYCKPEELAFLQSAELATLRKLVQSTQSYFQEKDRPLFQRLNTASNFFPVSVVAFISERTLGPLFCARIAMEMSPERAAEVARRFSPRFLAKTAAYMDTAKASQIAATLPMAHILKTSAELVKQKEFILMGNLVKLLPTFLIEAVLREIPDGEALLRIAYFVEDNSRLNEILEILPTTHIHLIITAAADEQVDLWPEAISLMSLVSSNWQARLVNMAADEDENTLSSMVRSIAKHNLWHNTLPLLHLMTEANRRRVINQPALHDDNVIQQLLRATEAHSLWHFTLPLIPFMEVSLLKIAAHQLVQSQDSLGLHHLLQVCQWQQQWHVLLMTSEIMSDADQRKIVASLADTPDDLIISLLKGTHEHALWHLLLPLLAKTPENTLRRIVNLPDFLNPAYVSNMVSTAQMHHLWQALFTIAELLPENEQRNIAIFAETFDSSTIYNMGETLADTRQWPMALRLLMFMRPERRASVMLQISHLPDESINGMMQTLHKENNWDLLINPLASLPDYAGLQILQRSGSLDIGLRARLLASALQTNNADSLLIHINALPAEDIKPHLDLITRLPEPLTNALKAHIKRLGLDNLPLP